ncbi:MAG TPA: bifunctional pyr operon transcriptional regulator/uracil phosphoribosyltransferase PyrR [Candidatus Acidoferrales bacterium]|nr:bifunctional pyr operon transcriptional regulator/uracil phosphoribosyltransferase PyrR [Candidatus Acidoferrales bacterium]
MKKTERKKIRILDAAQIRSSLERMAKEILSRSKNDDRIAFIGIRTRGLFLAKRLCNIIKKSAGREVPLGEMDITLYRDDLNALVPEGRVDNTRIPFDINDKKIILFDDVLHRGRTARAAVDHLIDLGRPKAIHLAVLIDRGGRELPIAASFVGKKINLPEEGEVQVRLREVDRVDEVVITR